MLYDNYNWITDRLAIGGMVYDSHDDFPFDTVLSLETVAPHTLRSLLDSGRVEYRWQSIIDGTCHEENDEIVRRFDAAADQIHAWQSENRCTLVHCFAGVSRSVTAVVWYLMRYHGKSWDEAMEMIRGSRQQANPNIRFEIPLRLASGETLTEDWTDQRIAAYCQSIKDRFDLEIDADEIWADLESQGTIHRQAGVR